MSMSMLAVAMGWMADMSVAVGYWGETTSYMVGSVDTGRWTSPTSNSIRPAAGIRTVGGNGLCSLRSYALRKERSLGLRS